uniref:ubiquitinyl hydrolase 1 n=1 Tax=Setaria digitata TaxID=48799 RepID=A0A915PWD6_9BILA
MIFDCFSGVLHHCTGYTTEPKIPFGDLLRKPLSLPAIIWQSDKSKILSKVMVNNTTGHHAVAASLIISLLLENCDGKLYDRKRKRFSAKIKVGRGHLLHSAVEDDLAIQQFNDTQSEINNSTEKEKDILFMKCLEFGDVYLRVSTAKVALLTDFETSLLKAVNDIENRFRFHQCSDLFNFVSQLSLGDRVSVQLKTRAGEDRAAEGCFRPGWVEWFGEPIPESGCLFGIRLEIKNKNNRMVTGFAEMLSSNININVTFKGYSPRARPKELIESTRQCTIFRVISKRHLPKCYLKFGLLCFRKSLFSNRLAQNFDAGFTHFIYTGYNATIQGLRNHKIIYLENLAKEIKQTVVSAVGDMDGFFNGRRLFVAPRNGAVLVSGDRLRNPRNVSILDEDPTFSVYGFSSHVDRCLRGCSPLRQVSEFYQCGGCDSTEVPVSVPTTQNEGIIIPIKYLENNTNTNNSSNVSSSRPVIREIPIQIMSATKGSHSQVSLPSCPPSSASSAFQGFPVDSTDGFLINSDVHQRHQSQQKIDTSVKVSSLKNPLYDSLPSETSCLKDSLRSLMGTRPAKLPIATETMRLKSNEGGLMEGDRVVWFDALGIPRRGTARWIGYLRGHTNIYVGVDFDEAIGGGTGYFECVELFRCAPNHAGLLPLSVCMREADMGDEENNITNSGNLGLRYFSFEQLQPPPTLPIQVHKDISYLQSDSLASEKENKDVSKLAQFTIGSCVEVFYRNERRCGVVKWIGANDELAQNNKLVAVEIEGVLPYEWQTVDKTQLEYARKAGAFANASPDSIALVPYYALRSDDRFALSDVAENNNNNETQAMASSNFGSLDSGVEVRPCLPVKNIDNLLGRMKGIQGFRNSCYLDTTLYAMFAQCSAFDRILESRCETEEDSIHTEVTDILKTEIVYPLRRFHFIRADHVLKLRRLLERLLPKMKGLTTDEKDPEELLNALFNTVLRVEPFLIMRNITDGKTNPAYICPLITEDLWSEEQRRLISVQTLLERSLFASNIQFAYEPKVLILQLPRYGQQKVFDKIFPPQEMDITHLIYESKLFYCKRPCISCGKRADMMCPECFLTKEVFIGEVTYCGICYERTHCGLDHQPQQLTTSNSFSASSSLSLSRRMQVPQKKLQLSSVLCIETSHYVAFVHAISANKWIFFDSMADRVGLSDGYNVPQVKLCEKMSNWLSDVGWCRIRDCVNREGHFPNDVENDSDLMRLLSDCYICFYTDEENKNDGLSLSRFFS